MQRSARNILSRAFFGSGSPTSGLRIAEHPQCACLKNSHRLLHTMQSSSFLTQILHQLDEVPPSSAPHPQQKQGTERKVNNHTSVIQKVADGLIVWLSTRHSQQALFRPSVMGAAYPVQEDPTISTAATSLSQRKSTPSDVDDQMLTRLGRNVTEYLMTATTFWSRICSTGSVSTRSHTMLDVQRRDAVQLACVWCWADTL